VCCCFGSTKTVFLKCAAGLAAPNLTVISFLAARENFIISASSLFSISHSLDWLLVTTFRRGISVPSSEGQAVQKDIRDIFAGRSHAEIVGSNPTRGMDICLL
jgi:hypothetical protein